MSRILSYLLSPRTANLYLWFDSFLSQVRETGTNQSCGYLYPCFHIAKRAKEHVEEGDKHSLG